MNFSAVILAGGKSSRMGRDKAFLEVERQPLLTRQIGIVGEAGAGEVFVSGGAGVDYSQFGCPVVYDRVQGAGPIGGIEAGLTASAAPFVLILAVDMLWVDAQILRELVGQCRENRGIVPMVDGEIEPLAAIYPKSALTIAQGMLSSRGPRSARLFAARCVDAGLAHYHVIPRAEGGRFRSCNTSAEFHRWTSDSLIEPVSGGRIIKPANS